MGDFIINTEHVSNADSVVVNDTMQALGLIQHVTEPMHQKGTILDLIFTVENCKTHTYISDDCMITMNTNLKT